MFGNYAGFILASYGICTAVITFLVLWVILDGRTQAKAISELEARGVHRRSARRAARTARS